MSEEEDFASAEEQSEFVPVIFARSREDAERYRDLLEDHNIPAVVGTDADDEDALPSRSGMTHGVDVLVPEALLDEASEIIADREDLDEFAPTEEVDDDDEDEDDDFGLTESESLDPDFDADEYDDEEEDEEDEDENDDDPGFLGLDDDDDEL